MGDIHSLVEIEGNFKIIQFISGTILPLVVTLVTSTQIIGEYNKLFEVPLLIQGSKFYSFIILFIIIILHLTTASNPF